MAQTWEKVFTFQQSSVDTGKNGAEISDGDFQKLLEWVTDNGVLEKAGGVLQLGTQLESGSAIWSLFRSWDKAGNKVLLAYCNGKIKRWTGSTWSDVQTGLTTGIPCDFINVSDKTAIINGYDEALEFNPSDNSIRKLGIEPPRFYKQVSYFETDETAQWSLGSGCSFNSVFSRIEERTGTTKQSLYITAGAAATIVCTRTYSSAQNFSAYANGISISNDDFFCMSVLHRSRDYVSSIYVDFITSAGNYYRLTIGGTELDSVYARDNVWTHLIAKKARFVATGTPSWSNITQFAISLVGVTGTAEIYCDNAYWKNPPIEATKYKKFVENFESPLSVWTVSGGTLTDNLTSTKTKEGTKSLKVVRSGATTSFYRTVSLDLSEFIDGVSSQTSDEISFWVYIDSTANLTSITITLSSTVGSKYFAKAFTVAAGDINKTTTGTWTNLKASKSDFVDTGTANWAAIVQYKIDIATTGACTLYFDDCCLQEKTLIYNLCTMENSETWVYGTAGSGGFNTDGRYKSSGNSSIRLIVPNNNTYTVTRTLAAPINLNQFSGGEASGDTDIFSFWVFWNFFENIKSIKLQIDCNAGDFATDYYEYEVFPEMLKDIFNPPNLYPVSVWNRSCDVEIIKSDFTKIGDTSGKDWGDVIAYRFAVTTTDKAIQGLDIYFDNLHMRRRRGISGIYQWCCVFCSPDGTKSGMSEWSEQITFEGTKALMRLLPISADTWVSERRFYRKGGSLGSTARLDFSIYDNTTTSYFTSTSDDLLGELLDENEIPQGTIRVPLCQKWGPKFKGAYTMYGDPLNLRRLYYSLPDKIYGWSELQAWDMPSDILNCFVINNIYFINTKTGMRVLSVPFKDATYDDFEEKGITKQSVGFNASCDVEGPRAVISYDGVYLFDGYSFHYISEKVKDYFDSTTYTLSGAILFYRKRHLYVSVITTGGTRKLLDYYTLTQAWRTSDLVVNCFCIFDGSGDNGEIYIGDKSGNIYQFDTGYAVTSEAITKDFDASEVYPPRDSLTEMEVKEMYIMARSSSASPGLINIQFRINQTLNTAITKAFPKTGNLTSAYGLYYNQLEGGDDTIGGNKIGLSIVPGTASKHIAIQSIKLIGEFRMPKCRTE